LRGGGIGTDESLKKPKKKALGKKNSWKREGFGKLEGDSGSGEKNSRKRGG